MQYHIYYVANETGKIHFLKCLENGCVLSYEGSGPSFPDLKSDFLNGLKNAGFFALSEADGADQFDLMVLCNTTCNLSCPYCFENGTGHNKILSQKDFPRLLLLIHKLIDKKKKVNCTFTGGEPMLFLSSLEKIVQDLKQTSKDISYSLITNGTFFPDGSGTFDSIIDNACYILSKYPEISLCFRVNIVDHKVQTYENLIDMLIDRFGSFIANQRLSIQFAFLDVNNDSSSWFSNREKSVFLSRLLFYQQKCGLSIQNQYDLIGKCIAKIKNSAVIYPDLSVYKCFSLAGNPQFEGKDRIFLPYGSSSPASLECSQKRCFYYSLCLGGCPYRSTANI